MSARKCSAAVLGGVLRRDHAGNTAVSQCGEQRRGRRWEQAVSIELAMLSPAVNHALAAVLGGVWCLEPFPDIVHHDDGNLIAIVETSARILEIGSILNHFILSGNWVVMNVIDFFSQEIG